MSDVKSLRTITNRPINDAGTKDWWPIWAETMRRSMFHATGANGFHKYPVIDRAFPYKHGDGIQQKHIENFILPSISTGRVLRTPILDAKFKKKFPLYVRRIAFWSPVWGGVGYMIFSRIYDLIF